MSGTFRLPADASLRRHGLTSTISQGVLHGASRIRCNMREEAQAVIIGGGGAGCSIAYHLTLMGWRDIVLVGRGQLTGGGAPPPPPRGWPLRRAPHPTPRIMYNGGGLCAPGAGDG